MYEVPLCELDIETDVVITLNHYGYRNFGHVMGQQPQILKAIIGNHYWPLFVDELRNWYKECGYAKDEHFPWHSSEI